jgi:hypothetical protein
MRRRIARILPPRRPACAPCEPRGRVWRDPAMASQRDRTAADVARPPARRLRRTWARWMRRRITHILPPRSPACAACEPRGRVWRDPAVASAARCRNPRPGALPCPTNPPSCAESAACLWSQLRCLRPRAALLCALGGAPSASLGAGCPRGQLNAAEPSGCAAAQPRRGRPRLQCPGRNSIRELTARTWRKLVFFYKIIRAFTHYL